MARQLDMDVCCRCGEKIKDIEKFTIDHVQPWENQADARTLFFDLENVAFAHRYCNCTARYNLEKVIVQCDYCGSDIEFSKARYDEKIGIGQRKFYCNRVCFNKHGGYKRLTESQVRDIRYRYGNGESTRNIAKLVGISHVSVFNCATGKTYKYIAQ